jgi:hypothetical protein
MERGGLCSISNGHKIENNTITIIIIKNMV